MNRTVLTAAALCMLAFVLLGTATFAWFTNNSKVGTNTVTGKSAAADMKLLIGADEGALQDSSRNEVEIQQVNEADKEKMYPVSTADLNTFLYASSFDTEGRANGFAKDENEEKFFHGIIYFRLEGENISDSTTYRLYLDNSEEYGGVLGESSEGDLLNASRLGLLIGEQEPVILYFEETTKGTVRNNTVINGVEIGSGKVLDETGNPVDDPAVDLSQYSLDSSQIEIMIPEKSLGEFQVNQTYPMEVFYYLEGCDEDCVDEVSKKECEIHLALYAITE